MRRSLLLIVLLTGTLVSKAQWECPSKLAAYLDPVAQSHLLWGTESQLSTGVLDGNSINTAMLFTGLDYSWNKHSFYFEGGFKAWWKYDFDEEVLFDQYRFGLREFFYQYTNKLSTVTFGLQSAAFDDYYLMNERIVGANYKLDLGKWKLNAYSGTVTKNFARNGIFCTTGFIYDLSTGQESVVLGNSLGDKNMGGFTFSFFPGKENRSQKKPGSGNEFENVTSDEFQTSNDEFAEFSMAVSSKSNKTTSFSIEQVGLAGYSEFGGWIDNTFYQTGIFASIKLPGNIYFNPEALFQIETSNKGIIYLASLEKSFSLNGGKRLSLDASYYAFSAIDDEAVVLNSYSNIFAGEVLRLDAVNMPFYLFSAKFNVPAPRFHIKLQNACQLNTGNLNEWDMEIGKSFFKQLYINAKAGIVQGGDLTNNAVLGRLEARFYF